MLKTPKATKSQYVRIKLDLVSAYRWGYGWNAQDEEAFETEIFGGLKDAGFEIKEGRGASASTLKSESPNTSVYLHPMCFSGYCTRDELLKILLVLENAANASLEDADVNTVYDLTDEEYLSYLEEIKEDLISWLNARKDRSSDSLYSDIAEEIRVPRVGDSTGVLCSSDVDIKYIEDLKKTI